MSIEQYKTGRVEKKKQAKQIVGATSQVSVNEQAIILYGGTGNR
jgi:hypothetical protein